MKHNKKNHALLDALRRLRKVREEINDLDPEKRQILVDIAREHYRESQAQDCETSSSVGVPAAT